MYVYNENYVDSAVLNLTAIVSEAINQATPFVKYRNSSFPHWFFSTLKYYIKKKNQHFRRYEKSKSAEHYTSFSHYRKLVKIAVKSDRLRFLKSVDSNLRTQPKQFWKCVSKFKNNYHSVTQNKSGDNFIAEQQLITEAFADHFRSIFNCSSATQIHHNSVETTSSDFLNVLFVFDSDIRRAIRRLKSTKLVGPNGIPSFIIKGCSEIFVPVIKHIFNLRLSNGFFSSLWKESAAVLRKAAALL
jgi:hypothetical protein